MRRYHTYWPGELCRLIISYWGTNHLLKFCQSFRQLILSRRMWTQLTLMRAVICATLSARNAKWHKSCRLRFYPRELQIVCARKSWIAFGAGKHFRYIAAHELAATLGGDEAKTLVVFHAFAGCDTTSSFAGQFRKSAWETWSNFSSGDASLEVYLHSAELSESCN